MRRKMLKTRKIKDSLILTLNQMTPRHRLT
nr:MAG TPA: hypothetical protein [Caudoviricetes sp.]